MAYDISEINSLLASGETAKAKDILLESLESNPNSWAIYQNLGAISNIQKDMPQAIFYSLKSLQIKPDNLEVIYNLAGLYRAVGEELKAQEYIIKMLKLNSKSELVQNYFSTFMKGYFFEEELNKIDIKNALLNSFRTINNNHQHFFKAALKHLYTQELTNSILEFCSMSQTQPIYEYRSIMDFLRNELVVEILNKCIVTDPNVEIFLIYTRKAILKELIKESPKINELKKIELFLSAFAKQSFFNEYVYFVSDEEKEWLRYFKEKIENLHKKKDKKLLLYLYVFGMYENLNSLEIMNSLFIKKLRTKGNSFNRLCKIVIDEINEEKNIKESIKVLNVVLSDVSNLVREQYEQNPYPRWITLGKTTKIDLAQYIARQIRLEQELFYSLSLRKKPDIFIAGCGTGRQPLRIALDVQNSSLTAIDLSLTSISYAKRKANEINIKNINFFQADIMELDRYEKKFDLVESIGVLHHLEDPVKGWKNILSLLKNGGIMKIGLYSKIARLHVDVIRKFIRDNNLTYSEEAVRVLRQHIMENASGDVVKIFNSTDFYSISGMRDLVFHVQEKEYTLLEIKETLESLDLIFLGFQVNESIKQRYIQLFPNDTFMRSLDNWHLFEKENPDIFIGMYNFYVMRREEFNVIMDG